MRTKAATIDEYLASLPADERAVLEKLRRTIHAVIPGVEECISYLMPAFRVDGQVVAGFHATSNGFSYYPFSGSTLAALDQELTGFRQTKSALHFDGKRGLPAALVRKLLKTRLVEITTRTNRKRRLSTRSAGRPRPAE